MTNTYKFTLPTNFTKDVATGFVTSATDWRYSGTDGTNTAEAAYGQLSYPLPETPDPNFIPFDKLTEADILKWVEESVGEEQIKKMQAAIDAKLAKLANPTSVTVATPWEKQDV